MDDCYNRWANQYNSALLGGIHCQGFGGIQLRFAIVKGVIPDIGRMRPRIPQRPEEALSDKAEMALHAARKTIKIAGKSPA